MKRKYCLIFGTLQATGALSCIGAYFLQDPLLWVLSSLVLLPGSLDSLPLFMPGRIGANWSLLTLGAIAVTANSLLFALASFLLATYRKSK